MRPKALWTWMSLPTLGIKYLPLTDILQKIKKYQCAVGGTSLFNFSNIFTDLYFCTKPTVTTVITAPINERPSSKCFITVETIADERSR